MSFLAPMFAIAGLAAAAGPIIIHLLNRRRFRIIEWAAMDFLREAIFRSRRILQFRDLLLMALRMLCLIVFGAALARPYTTRSAGSLTAPDQPVHAVILVDNSLSMGYRKLDGTLLDEAKQKVKETIEKLPRGSRISVVPTCGSATGFTLDAYFTPEEAMEAVGRITPVDRSTRPDPVIDLAIDACRRLPTMTAKQIFLVSDQHMASWPAEALREHLQQLPSPLQPIEVKVEGFENAWVADLQLRDGMADLQTPGVFVAKIGYEGAAPRQHVEVSLKVDGVEVATQIIDLMPGQEREVQFPPYRFEVPVEAGKPGFVAAEVSIPNIDALEVDNHRFLVVPVMAALPVVFIDQLGREEDPRQNRYGDTYLLRRLLAPFTSRTEKKGDVIQIRHVKMDELTKDVLADARLVVIAGVSSPKGMMPLLQQYVEQGGNLVIAAGGAFDPASWTEAAWADGAGILPAPLKPVAIGQVPQEAVGRLEPFWLDFDSLAHQYFWPEGANEEEVRDSLSPLAQNGCLMFKAVVAEVDDAATEKAVKAVAERLGTEREQLARIDKRLADLVTREARLRPAETAERSKLEAERIDVQEERAAIRPDWLLWKPLQEEDSQESIERAAERTAPAVLARYSNRLPFAVQRRLGLGQVLLLTTSVSADWTTMPRSKAAAWVYDRILRQNLLGTVPQRTLSTEQHLVLPVAMGERSESFTLRDPAGIDHSLSVDALGGNRYGVTLGNLLARGIYRVTAAREKESASSVAKESQGAAPTAIWEVPVAVNGPSEESKIVISTEADSRPKGNQQSFLDATQASVSGFAAIEGREWWRWLLMAALACLLLELALLAWTYTGGERMA